VHLSSCLESRTILNGILLAHFRQLILCRVTLGKSFLQFSAMKMAHAPPGHHSVIGRPSVGGLTFAEYVVYRGEQVRLSDVVALMATEMVFMNAFVWNVSYVQY